MPFCKECGTFYPRSMGTCPQCNALEQMNEQARQQEETEPPPPELTKPELKRMLVKRWLAICLGIPGLILFVYLLFYMMKVWKS